MTTKKVVFVHTPCYELDDDRLEPPLGILYLATLLQNSQIPCEVCDLSGVSEVDWPNKIAQGDIYAFSTYSVTYHRTLQIKRLIKETLNQNAFTIAGGPHVSALPVESARDFDQVIIGEAENTFLESVQAIQSGQGVSGILMGDAVSDLDALSFPNYELVDLKSYKRIVNGKPSISLISSRGCPYNCEFCNSRVFNRGQLRFRSPENVVAEIKSLIARYGTTSFRFNDDLFTFSPGRIAEMTQALKPLGIRYRVFARSSSLTEESCRQLYDSGCCHVAIGIESMSEKMLKILKKKTTVGTNITALQNAKTAGLKTRIYLLIGFPGETEETVQETIKVLLESDFDEFVVYPFIPYPGTSMWEKPEIWKAQIDRDYRRYVQVGRGRSTCYAVTTADFTPADVERWRQRMIAALEEKKSWAGQSSDNR